MSKMYVYFQRLGGEEKWTPIQTSQSLAELKPTFVTVLALDTIIDKEARRETLDTVKYAGPMYLDLDAADIADSIAGGKALLEKLNESGLKDWDIDIFLSGKKGLHFLIPEVCFMEKVQPTAKLPAIYKEIAFKLAVDTVDFAVYTAGMGRMLRTCYNVRENGNYKVPITADELRNLTPETYAPLCKAPRSVEKTGTPAFRPEFALIYDAASQKVASTKRRKPKPVEAAALRKALPSVQKILAGEGLADIGFNKIAIQLAVFARESNWNEATLVENAQVLCQVHQSDGRYSTPKRREHELRRMFSYVQDNPAYEYDQSFLRSCLQKETVSVDSYDEGEAQTLFDGGVRISGNSYVVAKGEDGEQPISNFVLRNVTILREVTQGKILGLKASFRGEESIILSPLTFTSSSSLQNTVAPHGLSFAGSDSQARGVYQLMLKEVSVDKYIIDSEGMNLIRVPAHPDPELADQPFLVWADRYNVAVPPWVADKNISFEFLGYPEEKGVMQTDLTKADNFVEWVKVPGNKERFKNCLLNLFGSAPPEVVGKILGWMVASHYKQLFNVCYGQFPLLHVYGPAGTGKTQFTTSFLRMFYKNEEPKSTSPTSTVFAFMTLVTGSASIPVLLDEYKFTGTGTNREAIERYRGLFRDAYNGKETQRGGGNRTKENFNALNKASLSAPICFIAEAAETETAIQERSIVVSFRRAGGANQAAESTNSYNEYSSDLEPMTVLGKYLAANILMTMTPEVFRADFEKFKKWACANYLLQPGDRDKVKEGKMTEGEYAIKELGRDRPVYNATVALYGLTVVKRLLLQVFPEEFETLFKEQFKSMSSGLFTNHELDVQARMPEYIKVLTVMSDMSKTPADMGGMYLTEGLDYNLSEFEGKATLVINARFAYNKYRQFSRATGGTPMYPGETAFEMGLKEVPSFMFFGEGLKNIEIKTTVLDYEWLLRSGVPPFGGRVTPLNK